LNKSAILAYKYFRSKKPEFVKLGNHTYIKVGDVYYIPRFLKMGGIAAVYKSDFDLDSKDVRYLLFRMGETAPFMQIRVKKVLDEFKNKGIVEINGVRFKYPEKKRSLKIALTGKDIEIIQAIKEKGKFNSYSEVVSRAIRLLEGRY